MNYDVYVIQCKRARGTAPNPAPWLDYQPIEEGVSERQRLNALNAYRQQPTSVEWRLIHRTVTEEVVA